MALKYALDAAVVGLVTRQVWTPLDYMIPSLALRQAKLRVVPAWLVVAMVLWSLPFLWIGVSMTVRRALDAGRSPWLAALFFVPVVNYAVMLALGAAPSRPRAQAPEPHPVAPASVRSVLASLGVALAVGLGLVAMSTLVLRSYGGPVFLGIPFVIGASGAFVLNRERPRSLAATLRVAAVTVVLVGASILLFAIEGAICVAMALPIALPMVLTGAVIGRYIALSAPRTALHAVVVVLALPGLAAVDAARPAPLPGEVISSVEIEAPPEAVWRHVVTFGEIPDPPAWLFRLGVAYPVRATIAGHGPGAVRRCEFSTGAFVEPITAWDAPRRLSFDVAVQPDQLREVTPYRALHPPHLDVAFRARRGEFRLIPLANGRTRLEGSTWYSLEMAPEAYWRLWTEPLVHAIHLRVLAHIKRLAEAR